MRDFTPEEKELIAQTPITIECFNLPDDVTIIAFTNYVNWLEKFRKSVITPKGEISDIHFNQLISMLPYSYKVVKL